MFKRQRTGSVVCASCGSLVGVNDERCYTCGRRNPGLWGFGPALRRFGNDLGFITLVIWGCSALYAVMLVVTVMFGGNIMGRGLFSLFAPATGVASLFGASGAIPLLEGRWWTVLSAGWLHGSILHILFNMMWVRQLGPATAEIYGAGRMVIIYTIAGIVGFFLSSAMGIVLPGVPIIGGSYFTLGASASIFGLLGALVYYGRRGGSSMVHREAMSYAVVLFVMGLIMPGVDNWAHGGGFLGGFLAGQWLDPLKPERMDHFVGAAICMVVTALAIGASIVTAFL